MQAAELEDVFGAPVLVQMRESVARAAPGAPEKYMLINRIGQPTFAMNQQARGFTPVVDERHRATVEREEGGENAGAPIFSYTFEAMILPTQGERVQVCYENKGKMVVMYVRPSDILAVSVISEKPDTSVIARP
jgi:hypothetical protein